jgi:hypothetical protein
MSQQKRANKQRPKLRTVKLLCVHGQSIDKSLASVAYHKLEPHFPSGILDLACVCFEDDAIVVICREQDFQGLARMYQILQEMPGSCEPVIYVNGKMRAAGPPPVLSPQYERPNTPDAQGVQIDLSIKRTHRDKFN